MSELLRRWPLAQALGERLLSAYARPGRWYHDQRHLAEVLDRIDELAAAGEPGRDPALVRVAAWFHDAVYDAAPEAEERSAQWAQASLPGVGLDAAAVAEVVRLVRLTADHRVDRADRNGAVLVDADLAILASSRTRYDEYAAAVRREYAQFSDAEFRSGRARILGDLLAKQALFHTAHAHACWEKSARDNLTRELSALTATSTG